MNINEFSEHLGQIFAQQRKENGLSREALGQMAKIAPVTIQRLEGGKSLGIGLDNLISLSEALGVSIVAMLSEASEKTTKNNIELHLNWDQLVERMRECPVEHKEWIARVVSEMINMPLSKK